MPRSPILPGVYGCPSGASKSYQQMVRSIPGLRTYWAGQPGKVSTVSNYAIGSRFTAEAWVRWTSVAANRGILACWASNNGIIIWCNASSRIVFHVNSTSLDSGVVPTAGFWYHIAIVYDGTSRSIYINGDLRAGPTSGITPNAVSQPFVSHNYTGSGAGDLSGDIQDAAVYSRNLTANEIAQNFALGKLYREYSQPAVAAGTDEIYAIPSTAVTANNAQVNLGSAFNAVAGTVIFFIADCTATGGSGAEAWVGISFDGADPEGSYTSSYVTNITTSSKWFAKFTVPGSGIVSCQMKMYHYPATSTTVSGQVAYTPT